MLVIVNPDARVSPSSAHPAQVGERLSFTRLAWDPRIRRWGPTCRLRERNRWRGSPPCPSVEFGSGFFGSVSATPDYAGLSPGSVGLYQVNVAIPQGVSSGLVNVTLVFPDGVSNSVQIAIQ